MSASDKNHILILKKTEEASSETTHVQARQSRNSWLSNIARTKSLSMLAKGLRFQPEYHSLHQVSG